jgi:hypothetical protein
MSKIDQMIALLTEIRDSLRMPKHDELPCLHPEDQRTNLGSMGEEEWICRACSVHYGPVKKTKGPDGSLSQHSV